MTEYVWEDIHIGLSHAFTASFDPQMMIHFQQLSGDHNPLHVNGEYARSKGFADAVVFGLMTSSLYSRLVGLYLPGKLALLHGIDIDFKTPCHVGQELAVSGAVSYLNDAYRSFEVRASIKNTAGKLVSKATIRVGFHAE